MEYKASMDTLAQGLTAGAVLLFAVIGFNSVRAMTAGGDTTTILIHSGILLFLVAVVAVTYVLAPKGYRLEREVLVIVRPAGDVSIPLNDISEARPLEKGELRGVIRTFGSGGFFGYYGKFHAPRLGHMTFYTTRRQNRILVVTKNGKKIVLSPDDPSLADTLQKR